MLPRSLPRSLPPLLSHSPHPSVLSYSLIFSSLLLSAAPLFLYLTHLSSHIHPPSLPPNLTVMFLCSLPQSPPFSTPSVTPFSLVSRTHFILLLSSFSSAFRLHLPLFLFLLHMFLLLPLMCPLLLSISEITSPFKQNGNTCVMQATTPDIRNLLVDRGATLEQDRLRVFERWGWKYNPEQEHQRRLDSLQESPGGGAEQEHQKRLDSLQESSGGGG